MTASHESSLTTTPSGAEPPSHPFLGSCALLLGTVVLCLGFLTEVFGSLPFFMPRSWYTSRPLWYFLALASFGVGVALLRNRFPDRLQKWKPSKRGPRFQRLIVYTREGCHLCDDAIEILARYARWLPPLETVDIDSDPALRERYTTVIPVVEIDGRERFRGRVDEALLRRLIENTPPQGGRR